jgi:hypothetical protein
MREIPMNIFYKLAVSTLVITGFAGTAIAQSTLVNQTEGQGTITNTTNPSWDGYSEVALIPGASLMGPKSTATALYLGFTGGTEADIGNMVLYQTARNAITVLRAIKVTLGTTQSPQINLTSTSVCPTQPVSVSNPCIVRLDTLNFGLAPTSDYYLAIYFTLDTNNETISGMGQSVLPGALSGFYLYGDQTKVKDGGAVPQNNTTTPQSPFFLAYVTNQ